jgi:hypothetical protein
MRTIWLIAALGLLAGQVEGQTIVTRALSAGSPMTIFLAPGIVTVLRFPQIVAGVFGGGLIPVDSAHGETAVVGQIDVQHPSKSQIVLLEPVSADVRVWMTCMCGEKLYVFDLRSGPVPDVAVTLLDSDPQAAEVTPKDIIAARPKYDPELAIGFLRRSRDAALLKPLYPDLYQGYATRQVQCTSDSGAAKTTVTQIDRFSKEDAIVLRGTVSNETSRPLQFDPRSVTVQVANEVHPAKVCDVFTPIPPNRTVPIEVVIQGDIDGGRANLSINNEMRIVLPSEGTVWSFKSGGPPSDFNVPAPMKRSNIPLTQTGNPVREVQ